MAKRSVVQVFPKLKAWSYSVYTQWLKCPCQVRFEKIDHIKIIEPPNANMDRGQALHNQAQDYVKGKVVKLTEAPLIAIKKRLDEYKKLQARVEYELAFDRTWQPTSWFGPTTWLRIKIDAMVTRLRPMPPVIDIVDYKSGRIYDDHTLQRSLYGMGGLQLVQIKKLVDGNKLTTVNAQHVYLDQIDTKTKLPMTGTESYKLTDLDQMKKEWLARIDQMMNDTQYPTITGSHCRWCKYRKSSGGPCPEDM